MHELYLQPRMYLPSLHELTLDPPYRTREWSWLDQVEGRYVCDIEGPLRHIKGIGIDSTIPASNRSD